MKTVSFLLVAGARPNFMKIAPIIKAIDKHNLDPKRRPIRIQYLLVHTGQHYHQDMSEFFFRDLGLPRPDVYLGIGSGTHAEQTARTMLSFEKVCLNNKVDLLMVVGDVNSTVACALVAAKLSIPVAHVEAGLRSFDRRMPEEINRILTDQISDYLFTTSPDADDNLRTEGIPSKKIFFVGNVMIDTLLAHIQLAKKSQILEKLGLRQESGNKKYAVVTLHRPSNVDNPRVFGGILRALKEISERVPVIFPVHPRTLKSLRDFGLDEMVDFRKNWKKSPPDSGEARIVAVPPLGYLDFLCLMSHAAVVLTDSGGIQEETTILGIPCLTIRDNTERPITIREGTNILTGSNPHNITKTADRIIGTGKKNKRIPRYWDGKAAERIIDILTTEFC
jgi:UDP-N-acetylglucosamine 2-epimerase (non-hydrolysing)